MPSTLSSWRRYSASTFSSGGKRNVVRSSTCAMYGCAAGAVLASGVRLQAVSPRATTTASRTRDAGISEQRVDEVHRGDRVGRLDARQRVVFEAHRVRRRDGEVPADVRLQT